MAEHRRSKGLSFNIAQNLWSLVFVLGLMKTRQNFSHSGTDGDETLGTWGKPYISIQNNSYHITISHIWVPGMPSFQSIKGLYFLQEEGDLSSPCGLLSHPETWQSQVYKKRQEWSR